MIVFGITDSEVKKNNNYGFYMLFEWSTCSDVLFVCYRWKLENRSNLRLSSNLEIVKETLGIPSEREKKDWSLFQVENIYTSFSGRVNIRPLLCLSIQYFILSKSMFKTNREEWNRLLKHIIKLCICDLWLQNFTVGKCFFTGLPKKE